MSERGSFVTQFIHCEKCFEAAKKILSGDNKFFRTEILKNGDGSESRIIAGKIGGLYEGEEFDAFESEFAEELEEVICHKMTIAVISDRGDSQVYKLNAKTLYDECYKDLKRFEHKNGVKLEIDYRDMQSVIDTRNKMKDEYPNLFCFELDIYEGKDIEVY